MINEDHELDHGQVCVCVCRSCANERLFIPKTFSPREYDSCVVNFSFLRSNNVILNVELTLKEFMGVRKRGERAKVRQHWNKVDKKTNETCLKNEKNEAEERYELK